MNAFDLYAQRRYREAQAAFEQMLKASPDSLPAGFGLSTSLLKQGRLDAAEELLLKIQNSPYDRRFEFILLNNIAWISILRGDADSLNRAARLSQRAMEINQDLVPVKSTRACSLILSGDYDRGTTLFREIVKIDQPVDSETNGIVGFIMLGFALLRRGDREEAGRYLAIVKRHQDRMDEDEKILLSRLKLRLEEFREEMDRN